MPITISGDLRKTVQKTTSTGRDYAINSVLLDSEDAICMVDIMSPFPLTPKQISHGVVVWPSRFQGKSLTFDYTCDVDPFGGDADQLEAPG